MQPDTFETTFLLGVRVFNRLANLFCVNIVQMLLELY